MSVAVARWLPLLHCLLLAACSCPLAETPSRALQALLPNYDEEWILVVPDASGDLLDGSPAEESGSPLEAGFEEGDDQENRENDQMLTTDLEDQNQDDGPRPSDPEISAATWESSTILKKPQKRLSGAEKLGPIWIALVILSLVVGLAFGAVGGLFFLRLLKSK